MLSTEPRSVPASRDVPDHYRKGRPSSWHQIRRRNAVLSLLARVHGDVLDYGCGYGDLTSAMSRTHSVCGVDLDPERIAFARQEYPGIEFRVCSPDDAPFPDSSFDAVTSVVVLNFVPDAEAYLRSVRRLLSPGGHLILACKNVPVVRNATRRLLGRGPAPSRLRMRSRAEVKALLESQGFHCVEETYSYDPPFVSWKNFSDVAFGVVEQVLSMFRVGGAAGYFLLLAQTTEDNEPANGQR